LHKVLNQAIGQEQVSITTLHSAMNDQPVIDAYHHEDLRRTRSAFQSMVPVSTGLARGIERLLPELHGRIQAKAIRVPTLNVSCLDITLQTARDTTAAEVNQLLRAASVSGALKGLLDYTELPHASCDFNHDAHSAIVDGSQTRVSGPRLVNLLAWFDNEWGFANRMLDVAEHFLAVSTKSV
jgi:D-erythrose 4-phosphate dehydrogenase